MKISFANFMALLIFEFEICALMCLFSSLLQIRNAYFSSSNTCFVQIGTRFHDTFKNTEYSSEIFSTYADRAVV